MRGGTTRPQAIRMGRDDNVAVALNKLEPKTAIRVDQLAIDVREAICRGHKIALERIPRGGDVRRYGEVIGVASAVIEAGAHVHTHNVVSKRIPGT